MVRRLLYINGLAIISVILFHTSGMGFTAMLAWGQRYLPPGVNPMTQIGSLPYYGLRIIEQLVVFSIPAFLIVSGYFVAVATGRNQPNVSWKVVTTRIRNLVIPYLLWSIVTIGLKIFVEGDRPSPLTLVRTLLTGSANEVFYFVPLLAQFYILSPVLVPLARKHWKALLLGVAILQLTIHAIQLPVLLGRPDLSITQVIRLLPKWLFLTKILWFPLGLIFGFHLADFKRVLFSFRWWLAGAAILLIPLGFVEWEVYFRLSGRVWLEHSETLIDSLYSLAVVFGLLAFERANYPMTNLISDLGAKSFGIYLTHAIVIEYVAKIIYRLMPELLGYQILLQPVLIVCGLGVPLLMITLMNALPVRKHYTYVFG